MLIQVLPAKGNVNNNAIFSLVQDNWNDYHFQTQYQLYLSADFSEDDKPIYIGTVKILKTNQTEEDGLQLNVGELESLNDQFCSLGQSLDYYQRLSNIEDGHGIELLNHLRDVIALPELKESFENETGWKISLTRDMNADDDLFLLAPMCIENNFEALPSLDLEFSFKTSSLEEPISFNFSSPSYDLFDKETLPSRLAVIIGRNGSGKSTLLSKISRIAFASTVDRKISSLQEVGQFMPEGLGFPKIVNISYSSFDSFQVPGIYKAEKEQIAKDMRSGNGRYVFCGIRDISTELERAIPNLTFDEHGMLTPEDIINDRQPHDTLLKPIDTLAQEFLLTYHKIVNSNKKGILDECLKIIGKEVSFHELADGFPKVTSDDDINNYFMSKSTGHKFVLHSLINIVMHTERRTLILFDEPETHLHPPLLAVLMSAIRYVLNEQDAFSIVTTHSPVVLQETLKQHVYILKREVDFSKIMLPEIQTYGENIGIITSHIFGLSSDMTDYHSELDKVIQYLGQWGDTSYETVMPKIEKLFQNDISMQARAYIQSVLIKKQAE